MKPLYFESSDKFVLLLLELYLNKETAAAGMERGFAYTTFTAKEADALCRDYLPNLIKAKFSSDEDLPIENGYPILKIDIMDISKTINVSSLETAPKSAEVYVVNISNIGSAFTIILNYVKEVVELQKERITIELNEEYSATYDKETDTVQVGCQIINFSQVEELYNQVKKLKK